MPSATSSVSGSVGALTLGDLLRARSEILAAQRQARVGRSVKQLALERLKGLRQERISRLFRIADLIMQRGAPYIGQLCSVQPMTVPEPSPFYLEKQRGYVLPMFGSLDDGLVRNAEDLVRRRWPE